MAIELWQLRFVPRESEQVEVGVRIVLKHSRLDVGEGWVVPRDNEIGVDSGACLLISSADTSCNTATDTRAVLKVWKRIFILSIPCRLV